jgi:hypothetical protein
MKTPFSIIAALCAAAAFADPADPQISNFNVRQDAMRIVHVTFTLDEPAYITMDVLTNHVSIGIDNFSNATGDVNKLVPAGNRTITWEARESWPDQRFHDPALSVKLTAWAADNPPDIMDIDLVNKTVAYYQSVDFLPQGGLANDIYRTTHLVMKKVYAAGQTFTMGSPADENSNRGDETQHLVTLTNDYYLAIYETTRRQYTLLGCPEPNFGTAGVPYGNDDPNQCPQDRITYNRLRGTAPDINWPTTGSAVGGYLATIRTTTGLALDLPTEAQWEFACRAGTTTAIYTGKANTGTWGNSVCNDIAWFTGTSTENPHAVGGKQPNAWGFYDMYGNIMEWCLDWYATYDTSVSPAVDPQGPSSGSDRVMRSSFYYDGSKGMRSAWRAGKNPTNANEQFGFRLCLTLP